MANGKKEPTTDETVKILEGIIDKMLTGTPYTLTTKEQTTLVETAGGDPTTLGISMDEFNTMLGTAIEGAGNRENFMARLERKVRRGEATEKLAAGLGVVNNLIGVGVSANQIAQSNRTLRGLREPTAPGVPQLDPRIEQNIAQAQQGTFDPARAAAASRAGLDDQYLRDIAMAKDISGGNVGTYGALGQVASLRRGRGMAELTPLIDNIRSREQSRLDQLLQDRQQFEQQNYQNRLGLYNTALSQYNAKQQAVGAQGAAGRENLYGSLNNLAGNLSVVGGDLASRYYTGNKDIDEFDQSINTSLSNLRPTALTQDPAVASRLRQRLMSHGQRAGYQNNFQSPSQFMSNRLFDQSEFMPNTPPLYIRPR